MARKRTGVQGRLEQLRRKILAESISYGEIAELQSLARFIDPGDVLLLEWAGVPEKRVGMAKRKRKYRVEVLARKSVWVAAHVDFKGFKVSYSSRRAALSAIRTFREALLSEGYSHLKFTFRVVEM